MFVQHQFIEEQHKAALESTIRQHAGITEPFLAKLYKAALDVYTLADQAAPQPGLVFSRIANEKHVVASVTDERTGTYLQLAGEIKKPNVGKQLTMGQKWIMQGSAASTTATKLW
jgi:hypothetical protein